jgi:hypothetical protein
VADLRAAFVATVMEERIWVAKGEGEAKVSLVCEVKRFLDSRCFLGALPPVDLRAVCWERCQSVSEHGGAMIHCAEGG